MWWTKKNKTIIRTGDLAPKGIRSTISSELDFNGVFGHIAKELGRKKDGNNDD